MQTTRVRLNFIACDKGEEEVSKEFPEWPDGCSPNDLAKDLHRILAKYTPFVIEHGQTLELGKAIVEQSKDREEAFELLEDTTALLRERVDIESGVRELATEIRRRKGQ
jgi:hypothetical protein